MENLNAEQVKKALECCHSCNEADCKNCGYRQKAEGVEDLYISCTNVLIADALALVTSQEQRIGELTAENERLRAENAKYEAENHAQFDKWLKLEEETKRHHSELFEEAKVAVKEETVRKMQERLKAECNKYLLHSGITLMLHNHIDQIAKEMLEGKDDNT